MNMTACPQSTELFSILIVDDEPDVLSVTKAYLKNRFKFHVETASSADSALSMTRERRYDAIIADYEMEGMSGLELLKILRAEGDGIPFIIFTGRGREEVVIEAYENGADGYVQKGCDISAQFTELAHRVNTIIHKKRGELAHKKSEQEFQRLYEEAPVAYFSLDPTWMIIRCNIRAEELTGKTREFLVRSSFIDLFPDIQEGKGRLIVLYNRFCAGDPVSNEELVIEGQDNTFRWVTFSIRATRDDTGKISISNSVLHDITKRKQAEETLRESEERFRQLFNNASDAIFLHEMSDDGRPGKFIEVNDAACEKLGYSREELLNMGVSDINTPESNAIIPDISPVLFDKFHVTFECSHQKKDGGFIPVEVAIHLFHLNNQNVTLAICRDISDRKSAEEALSRSERQMVDIIDFLPDATFVVDKTGSIIAWNQAIEKMTGILASDMIGKGNYEYALPFLGERRPILIDLAMRFDADISKNYKEFKQEGEQVISESIIANFRGEDVYLWSVATPLYDQSGLLIGSIESIRDVTERKKTDDALHEALDTVKTVMDSLEALVYVCDMETHEILFLNRFGRTLMGDVIGRKCYRIFQDNQKEPCQFCTNEKIVDNKGDPTGVYTWERQNTRTEQWYHCRDSAIRWIDGRIVRLEIATNITEQKLTENALKQANRQLNLLSGITRHDILNTVTAMQLLMELAKMKMDISAATNEFKNLESAISVIQSQIEFTRVYQDLGSHTPQWISLHHILLSLNSPHGITIINKSADIEIFSDPLLSKVFENLLDNSIRHGKKTSTITIMSEPGFHDMVIIYEDDGIGIPADEKEVIFKMGSGKNTGFGLFFIREILSITGIFISESGQEGSGVRFEISLPKEVWRYRSEC